MKNCLSVLSTFLAALCAFLFIIVTSLTLVVFIGDRLLLNPSTYKQALNSENAYDTFPTLIAEQIVYQVQHPGSHGRLPTDLQRLTQDDWEVLLSDILTPESIKIQAESLIDQIFTYVNTPGAPLDLQISLVDFKQKLDGDIGFRAA